MRICVGFNEDTPDRREKEDEDEDEDEDESSGFRREARAVV